jgi:hypothetical protein
MSASDMWILETIRNILKVVRKQNNKACIKLIDKKLANKSSNKQEEY